MERFCTICILVFCLCILMSSGIHAATVASYFGSDSEGWVQLDIAQGTYNITNSFSVAYSSTGGNPGGHILGQDFGPSGWSFGAPAKFIGNKSTFIGGTASFDLLTSGTVAPVSIFWIRSSNILMVYTASTPLTTSFTHYTIPLYPDPGWGAVPLNAQGQAVGNWFSPTYQDFHTVMSTITSMEVRGDWLNGNELSRLDNFELNGLISPSDHDFGIKAVGWPSRKQFIVTNVLSENLTMGALSITGNDSPEFMIQNDECSGAILAPQETRTFEVQFTAASLGSKTAAVTVPIIGQSSNPLNVPLTALVTEICECDLNADGRCDMRDWLVFGQRWGATNCNTVPCACDLNSDGRCDMRDWLRFGQDWGRTNCPVQ